MAKIIRYEIDTRPSRIDGEEIEVRCPVIRCCGIEILCNRFTNTCERCGADYGMSGKRLAPRSQWGEETGESVADILMADIDTDDDFF